MTVSPETSPSRPGGGSRFTEWLLGVVGGIATFLGLFILFAGEDQYVGVGGDLSWRVGDISAAWAYGLLIGGLVLLAGALLMVLSGRRTGAHTRTPTALAELLWHTGIFVVVNAFIWVQDIAIGGGVDYAYWVTIPWAIGLVSHLGVYLYSRRSAGMVEASPKPAPREMQPH